MELPKKQYWEVPKSEKLSGNLKVFMRPLNQDAYWATVYSEEIRVKSGGITRTMGQINNYSQPTETKKKVYKGKKVKFV